MKKLLIPLLLALFVSGCSINGIINKQPTDRSGSPLSNAPAEPAGGSGTPAPVPAAGKALDLSRRGLDKIDLSVFDLTDLEELNISYNNLTGALPSQIGKLKNLKVLNVSHNQMTGVPAEVGQLANLEILDLSNNQLTGLPYELGNLKKLKVLNLAGNRYSAIDLEIIRRNLPDTDFILK